MLRDMLGSLQPFGKLALHAYTLSSIHLMRVQPHTAGELMWMQWNWKNSTDGEPARAAYTCTG